MKKESLMLILCLLLVVVGVTVYWFVSRDIGSVAVSNFTECVDAGYPVMESYPRQCRTPDGQNFVEEVSFPRADKSNLIVVDYPKSGDVVSFPFTVKGKARGTWYFEASFPVELNFNGTVIGRGIAQAKSDWMTEEFVPFEAEVDFILGLDIDGPLSGNADLILKKDNPSGLPENDDNLLISVKLSDGNF